MWAEEYNFRMVNSKGGKICAYWHSNFLFHVKGHGGRSQDPFHYLQWNERRMKEEQKKKKEIRKVEQRVRERTVCEGSINVPAGVAMQNVGFLFSVR